MASENESKHTTRNINNLQWYATHSPALFPLMSVFICPFLCMWVRERKREKEKEIQRKRERERERERERLCACKLDICENTTCHFIIDFNIILRTLLNSFVWFDYLFSLKPKSPDDISDQIIMTKRLM